MVRIPKKIIEASVFLAIMLWYYLFSKRGVSMWFLKTVTSKIEPLFIRMGNLKPVTCFPTSNTTKVECEKYMNSVSCIVVFEALHLQAVPRELIQSLLVALKGLSWLLAVDLRIQMLGMKRCHGATANGRNSCFSTQEISQFLKKIGFEKNTTIYLTQNGWHNNFDELTNIYLPRHIYKGNSEKYMMSTNSLQTLMVWSK